MQLAEIRYFLDTSLYACVRIRERRGELEEPNVLLEWAKTGGIKCVYVVLLLLE